MTSMDCLTSSVAHCERIACSRRVRLKLRVPRAGCHAFWYCRAHDMIRSTIVTTIVSSLLLGGVARAGIPKGYVAVADAKSPDGTLGVIVPDAKHPAKGKAAAAQKDQLIELKTGRVVTSLNGDVADNGGNNTELAPRWSTDGTVLSWFVDGKWGSMAMTVVKLEKGKVAWQKDVRADAIAHLLPALQQAAPKAYAAAKAANKGNGSWYPDGLTVDVRASGTGAIALPMNVAITVTANPKQMDDFPKDAKLDGTMSGTLAADGTLTYQPVVLK